MGKIKSKDLAVEWFENQTDVVEAVIQPGTSTDTIIEELVNVPIDVKSFRDSKATGKIILHYPEAFADDRKQLILERAQEIYPDWKISSESNGDMVITPVEVSQEY